MKRELQIFAMCLAVALLILGVMFIPGDGTRSVDAQSGTPTPDQFNSNIFMWDGGNRMFVASGGQIVVQSGGEIEFESGGVLDVDGTFAGTNLDVSGYIKAGVATPSVVTSLSAGDIVASDDVEIVDDLHVLGAVKVGLATPVGITWDDDDLVVNDDAEVLDDFSVGGGVKAGIATPVVVTSVDTGDGVFSDDVEIVDDLHVTGAVKVGVPTPVGITWDDDDLAINDDLEVLSDSYLDGALVVGLPTPVIVTSPGVGDIVAKDDVEIQGDIDVAGTAELDGGITVDDTAFTVADTSGNIGTAGDLDVAGTSELDGGLTVDDTNFIVDGTTGAQTVAGLASLNGGIAVDTSNFTVDGTTGAISGASTLGITGVSTLTGGESIPVNVENIRQPSILAVPITYTSAAGGTGTVATIGAGEIWIIHDVLVKVTTSFVADTGNDAILSIGDGNDPDGLFIATNDANLISTYSEGTGWATGWVGMGADEKGDYLDVNGNGFVYNPVAEETIDWLVDETSGETLSAGAATIYVFYTRVS